MTRRRYVYRPHPTTGELQAVEVGSDYSDAPRSTGDLHKFQYDNLQSPVDGSDISSRSKYMRHLKSTGLVPSHELAGTRAEAAKERARTLSGESDRKERRETIGRTMYEQRSRGRK